MRFLVPTAGDIGTQYGVLTTPAHGGVTLAIQQGKPWAADNEAFTRTFEPSRFFPWLEGMRPYIDACLFVAVPDVVGDPIATMANFDKWKCRFGSWPLAFVAQDGQENLPLPEPDSYDALFIGGSTEWKESAEAVSVIKRAQVLGKHIHIGRINTDRRFKAFQVLAGSDDFTCDGTRTRFDGKKKLLEFGRGIWHNRHLFNFKGR